MKSRHSFGNPLQDVAEPGLLRERKGYTLKGSMAGTRADLEKALAFAADGKVQEPLKTQRLEAISNIFTRLKEGKVNGRIVLGANARKPIARGRTAA